MPTKKQRMLLKKEQKGKERLTYHRQKKLNRFVLVAAGVLISGGIFSGGWFLGASSSLATKVVSEVTPTSSLPEVNTEVVSEETHSSPFPEVERISIEALKAKLDADSNILIIDLQTETNYEQFHIAGAIFMPLRIMAETYSQLDGYDEIITYCN